MPRIADTLLPEWDRETATTRRVLQRLPEDRLEWRPHPRSWTAGELATHLATLPSWMPMTLQRDSVDIAPGESGQPGTRALASRDQLLQRFDGHVAAAREALAATDDATMMAPWSLLKSGTPLFTLPRVAVLRGFIFNHMIHHRGQLAVYLRLLDVPVPAIYGSSADEGGY